MLIAGVAENKRLEIRKERVGIRARYIHILKRPEDGCVSAIIQTTRAYVAANGCPVQRERVQCAP